MPEQENNNSFTSDVSQRNPFASGVEYNIELGAPSPIPDETVDYFRPYYPTGAKEFDSASVSLIFCSQSSAAHPVPLQLELNKSNLCVRKAGDDREYVYLESADIKSLSTRGRTDGGGYRKYIRIHFTTDPRRIVDSIWVAGDDYSWTRLASCCIRLPGEGGEQ
jgi:hypothetical protein